MSRSSTLVAALAALASGLTPSLAGAQSAPAPARTAPATAPLPVRPSGIPVALPTLEYDLATGAQSFVAPVSAGGQGGVQRALAACYSNSTTVGSYAVPAVGEEWIDWGDKDCDVTGFLGGFTVGYATTALDISGGGPGASLDIAIYEGTSGGGAAFLGTEIGRFSFTGLPGRTGTAAVAAYALPVSLPSALRLRDGDIGWSYVGVDGVSGPILVATSGTCFGTPDPATGTEDCFDIFTAPAPVGPYLGTAAFMTPGIASFYLETEEHDGSGSTSAVINGTGINPLLFSEVSTPIPSHVWTTMIDVSGHPGAVATIVVFSNDAFGPVNLSFGELLVDIAPASFFFQDVALGTHMAVAPVAPGLLGEDVYTQGAIFDPSSGGLLLVNGITFTMNL